VHGAVLRSVARAGVGVLLEELFRFSGSDRGRTRRYRLYAFSRGRSASPSGIHSPPGTSPGPTAAPHRRREARRDNRYASSAPAARACRLRGLVAAERNELRSMGASGSLGLCHLQSVDDVCHQPTKAQASIRQCTGN